MTHITPVVWLCICTTSGGFCRRYQESPGKRLFVSSAQTNLLALSAESGQLATFTFSFSLNRTICYLKSLFIFPNEFKLEPKIPKISRKCLEAKFRGRFCQVQQVNVKDKNYWEFPGVFIKLYKKFWAISTIKGLRKKSAVKPKNSNLIGSFSALGDITHIWSHETVEGKLETWQRPLCCLAMGF